MSSSLELRAGELGQPSVRVPREAPTDSIVLFLKRNKRAIVEFCIAGLAKLGKYDASWNDSLPDPSSREGQQFEAIPDYLSLYFQTGDVNYRSLYTGELLKDTHSPAFSPEEQSGHREAYTSWLSDSFGELARTGLKPNVRERFLAEIESMHRVVTTRARRTLNVVIVGDCLTLDIVTFLAGPCREVGIDFNPHLIGSYNPIELRNTIRSLPADGFSLVFYSPFTYTFTPDFASTLTSTRPFTSLREVRRLIAPGLDDVRATIDLLSQHFDCPVLVHNASNIRRHSSTTLDRLKNALTYPVRSKARDEANWILNQYVSNLAPLAQVSILDEHALLSRESEWTLGRRFYNSEFRHPTVLSLKLAETYFDYLKVHGELMSKKLLVCDLDNTLWKGEIGEGAVEHHHDRQATVKRLRDKGVLLAINSKNDPANVHWTGSKLSQSDFVATQINWNPKADNMARIRDALNLKTKDFIFIDDRPDQLEMVSATFPEILALDATNEENWRRLELWSRLLPDDDGLDRTQLYHEREKREGFIATEAQGGDTKALLDRLGLKAVLRPARTPDLKRVVELINRTNQFNLVGTRTTPGELREWMASPSRSIALVEGADKFGQMGIVGIALVETTATEVVIPAFVLSCRVFGYGFETALLNRIKRQAPPSARLVGHYRETSANQPCRSMYPDHGFTLEADRWVLEGDIKPNPEWLEVVEKSS